MRLTSMTTTLSLLLPSVALAFTCTGFDPVYEPGPKYSKYAAIPRPSSASTLEIMNAGAQRFMAAVDEAKGHGRSLSSSSSSSSSSTSSPSAQDAGVIQYQQFRLDKVSLPPQSFLGFKQSLDADYLMWLDPNSVVYNFRNTSNLPLQGASPWGGWEDPDCLLRGHYTGRWLSATAMMWNSTGNASILARAQEVISALSECAAANVNVPPVPGFLSGWPVKQLDDLENMVPYPQQWSPYYTLALIMGGLRDQYIYAGSTEALSLAEGMAGYIGVRVRNVIARGTIALWNAIMNQEFGNCAEVFWDLYSITGNATYLETAELFTKPCFVGPLAIDADMLDGMHANAHLPVVIGAARHYETLGDPLYSDIAMNFHHIMTHDHSYATGNGNHGEYWGTPGRLGDQLDGDTQETCSSANLLFLGRHIFSWTGDVFFADWYERLQTNGILSTQNPEKLGSNIYMLPLPTVNGSSKGWDDPIYSFTCCHGTVSQVFAQIADTLWFRQDTNTASGWPTLIVMLYHDSDLTWDGVPSWSSAGSHVTASHRVNWDDMWTDASSTAPGRLQSNITFAVKNNASTHGSEVSLQFTVTLRVPSWAQANEVVVSVNGSPLSGPFQALSWVNITRNWNTGDVISMSFPLAPVRVEYIRDDRAAYATTGAVMAGPYLLVSPSQVGSSLFNDPSNIPSWITPLSAAERQVISLAAGGGGPNSYLRHDSSSPTMNAVVSGGISPPTSGTDGPDSTFRMVTPGLTGAQGTVSVESINYPGFFLCLPSGGAAKTPLQVLNYDATSSSFNSSCTFISHIPGLTGLPNTISLELASLPGTWASWFGGGTAVTAQPAVAGNPQFSNMTTWTSSSPTWAVPSFSFRARASEAARAAGPAGGARDFLLYPIHEAITETYVAYFQIAEYNASLAEA